MEFDKNNENTDEIRNQSKEDLDNEFLEDFIVEASEHIDNIEMNIFTFEKEPENEEVINSMFRSFHTIKGLAGFVEQELIENLAHKTETLLDACRKKTIKADKTIAQIILTSSDYIRKICEDISFIKNTDFITEINNHIEKVIEIEQSYTEKAESKSAETPSDSDNEENTENFSEFVYKNEAQKLGEILVHGKKLEAKDVEYLIKKQKTDYPELKFGEVAIQEEKVKPKDVLDAVRAQKSKSSSKEEYMRISTDKVDNLVDMVGELVITQSLVEQLVISKLGTDLSFTNDFGRMSRITKDLQNLAMYLRMVSLKSTFQKITRIARDTINEVDKDIDFSTFGEDTEIDRIVTERLLDPLVHLVKNAVSHGIEPAEEREKAGKSRQGSIQLTAYNKRGNIYIEITDDGGGINTEKVYQKAIDKGLIDAKKEYSEKEIQEFIMLPGFSTMEVANNIAGRGVGMDVVKTQISKIGGKIEINSEKGKGSTFILKIPVNHAIMNGTVINIEGSNYIVPTLNVKQIIQPKPEDWVYVKNIRSRIKVRGEIIPILPISKLFGINTKDEEPKLILIVEFEQQYKALPVRNVIGRQEIVVKPVGEEFAHLGYISGMSILGDGKVSLILDVENIFKTEGVE